MTTAQNSVNASHLAWEIFMTGDHDEPEYEYFHPCLAWCDQNSIDYQLDTDHDPELDYLEGKAWADVKISMTFETSLDTLQFVLVWSEAS